MNSRCRRRRIDTALMLHALTYTDRPADVHSVKWPGTAPRWAAVLASRWPEHRHEKAVAPYGHKNLGFHAKELRELCTDAGLEVHALRRRHRGKTPTKFRRHYTIGRRTA